MALAKEVLDKKILGEINKSLKAIANAMNDCDLAESCQVDCTEQRASLEQLRQQQEAFKATYFPSAK